VRGGGGGGGVAVTKEGSLDRESGKEMGRGDAEVGAMVVVEEEQDGAGEITDFPFGFCRRCCCCC